MARLGTFRSLKQRNARLFFAGMLVSNCGTWMQSTAQGWLVYKLSGQALLGLVLACPSCSSDRGRACSPTR